MSTIFTKIINREIPGQFIYEDDICVAIMDKFPAVDGQTLIIAKEEIDYILDVNDETYQHLFMVARKVAKALDVVFTPDRTCIVVEGFEVPHVHIKLYPIHKKTEKNFATMVQEQAEQTDEILLEQAAKIKSAL